MSHINKEIAREYKRELDEFNNSDGHAITTPRRLTDMDVSKYDLVIIYSTIISSKDDISISQPKN